MRGAPGPEWLLPSPPDLLPAQARTHQLTFLALEQPYCKAPTVPDVSG